MSNQVVWFDIPAKNLERAIGFYSNILKITIKLEEFPGFRMGVFAYNEFKILCARSEIVCAAIFTHL